MTADELIKKLRHLPADTIVKVYVGYDMELYEAEDLVQHDYGSVALI